MVVSEAARQPERHEAASQAGERVTAPAPVLTPAQRAVASPRDLAPWFEDPVPHECPLCGSDQIIQRSCKVLCGTCRSIIQSCADL